MEKIEELRQANLICYITGDREHISTRVAPDVIRIFFRHLETLGYREKVDLFLYTRGGDVLTPWRLVHLLREYCRFLGVLVPFRAYSAGTLICLGADEIVMGKLGELGPIDPSVANPFNPTDVANRTARIPVSVEDVASYVEMAQQLANLKSEPSLAEVFTLLSEKVHPLALGNVYRHYVLIRSLARKLLALHGEDEAKAETIVASLTEKLYAHNHMISRREAVENIGLKIVYPDGDLERAMWDLYAAYEEDLSLLEPFNPVTLLPANEREIEFEAVGGVIESKYGLDLFTFTGTVSRVDPPREGAPPVQVNVLSQSWRRVI